MNPWRSHAENDEAERKAMTLASERLRDAVLRALIQINKERNRG